MAKEPTPSDSIRELVKQDKQRQKSLDETYIEWLRTKAAINRQLVDEDDIASDFDKMVIQDAEMMEQIANRLEGLICSLIDGED
ncbi:hypothetical protein NHG32_06985 [Aerococcaceae bacterium NML191219]|nr:hypothetical protein [Aerococcaceae bacterium NML191219]